MAKVLVYALTVGTSFTVPADFVSLISFECIGAAGNGFGGAAPRGGGGGAYAIQPTAAGITAGKTYTVHIGANGGSVGTSASPGGADTYVKDGATVISYAQGGTSGGSGVAGAGGAAAQSVPATGAFSGGTGNLTGGGGAAGKFGDGVGSVSGNHGGNGDAGHGGAGSTSSGSPGGNGAEWTYNNLNNVTSSGTIGSGGGGAGAAGAASNGGNYGAGGGGGGTRGLGTGGFIIFTYNSNISDFNPVSDEGFYANLIAATEWKAWPYSFEGDGQPYAPTRLNASIIAVPVNEPPYQNPGRTIAQQAIIAQIAQPDPWTYNFGGGKQPFDNAKLTPNLLTNPPTNPPFGIPPPWLNTVLNIWQPPWPYYFMGGSQPFAPIRITPSLIAVTVNNPPFRHPSRDAAQMAIVAMLAQQPDPWTFIFSGSRQPFDFRKLPPSIIAGPINNPPFGIPPVWLEEILSIWQPEWPYLFIGDGAPYVPRHLAVPFSSVAPTNVEQVLRNVIVRARILTSSTHYEE